MRQRALFGLAAIIVVSVASMAFAAPLSGKGGGPMPPGVDLVNELGLSEEQLAEIREIEADCFKRAQALQATLSEKMFELRQLHLQKDPDEDAIEAKRAEMQDLQEQVRTIQQEAQDKIKAVYTEEQLKKLDELKTRKPDMKASNMVKALGLTDEQLAKIREIETGAFQKTQAIRAQMEQKMFELRLLSLEKEPDEDAIQAKRAEVEDLQKQLRAIQEETQGQIKGVYTQDQLEKLNEMKPAGPGKGRGRGPGMGPGGPWIFGPGPEGEADSTVTPGAQGTVTD